MPMKARSIWIGGFKSVLDNGRTHSLVVDLPPDLGGSDQGPTALELAVMSLAGCVTTIFAIVAKKMRLDYEKLEAHVEAEKGEVTIESVRLTLRVKTNAPPERVRVAFKRTMEICPVGVLFSRAGVKIEENVEIVSS